MGKTNVVIVGGLGYVGIRLAEELRQQKDINLICIDLDLFNLDLVTSFYDEMIIGDICEELSINRIKEVAKEGKVVVVWCCDIDTPEFYETEWGIKYSQKMLECLKKLIELKIRLIKITDTANHAGVYCDYLNEVKILCSCCSYKDVLLINTGEVFGFSSSMRFDTFINRYIFDGIMKSTISVDNWYKICRFTFIDDIIDRIINVIVKDDNIKEIGIGNEVNVNWATMNIVTCAFLLSFINNQIDPEEPINPSFNVKEEVSIKEIDGKTICMNDKFYNTLYSYFRQVYDLFKKEQVDVKDLLDLRYRRRDSVMLMCRIPNLIKNFAKLA